MKPINTSAVAASQVTSHATHLLKLEASISAAAAPGLFLQVHDSAAVPAEGAAPVKWWPAPAGGDMYKEFKSGELALFNGCYICLSSTGPTKTLSVSVMDELLVELTDPEAPASVTKVGDRTTDVTNLQVWAEATGPKKLVQVYLGNHAFGAAIYFLLFAKDAAPAANARAIETLAKVANNANKLLTFGDFGRNVFSQDSDSTNRQGCTIWASQTADTYTALGVAKANIEAEYSA